jgi:hypothetical protein
MRTDFDEQWQAAAEAVVRGMKEWRLQHPRATLREIEEALDERLGSLRVRLLTDSALASGAAEAAGVGVCGQCGQPLEARGRQERLLTSQHNQVVRLERSYGVCPHCEAGFFPSG